MGNKKLFISASILMLMTTMTISTTRDFAPVNAAVKTGDVLYNTNSSTYYSSITATGGASLRSQLQDLMFATHYRYTTYSDCASSTFVYSTDAGSANGYVKDFYGQLDLPSSWGGGAVGSWTREHVWCQSLSIDSTSSHNQLWGDKFGGADLHHIRPVESTLNSSRNNNPYGMVGTYNEATGEYDYTGARVQYVKNSNRIYETDSPAGWLSPDSSAVTCYEPRDDVKGDVARILFYTYTHYYQNSGKTTRKGTNDEDVVVGSLDFRNIVYVPELDDPNKTPEQKKQACLNLLLSWNDSDPVSQDERNRNEAVARLQGNRNPYIDNPDYARAVFASSNVDNSKIYLSESNIALDVGEKRTIEATASTDYRTIYIEPNGVWDADNAVIAAYAYNGDDSKWYIFNKLGDTYSAQINVKKYTHLIFTRHVQGTTNPSWLSYADGGDFYNKTDDLTIGNGNCFTVYNYSKDNNNNDVLKFEWKNNKNIKRVFFYPNSNNNAWDKDQAKLGVKLIDSHSTYSSMIFALSKVSGGNNYYFDIDTSLYDQFQLLRGSSIWVPGDGDSTNIWNTLPVTTLSSSCNGYSLKDNWENGLSTWADITNTTSKTRIFMSSNKSVIGTNYAVLTYNNSSQPKMWEMMTSINAHLFYIDLDTNDLSSFKIARLKNNGKFSADTTSSGGAYSFSDAIQYDSTCNYYLQTSDGVYEGSDTNYNDILPEYSFTFTINHESVATLTSDSNKVTVEGANSELFGGLATITASTQINGRTVSAICYLTVNEAKNTFTYSPTGFEGFSTTSFVKGGTTSLTSNENEPTSWEMRSGCISSSNPINGNHSSEMRIFNGDNLPTNYPYLKNTTAISDVTKMAFTYQVSNTSVRLVIKASPTGQNGTYEIIDSIIPASLDATNVELSFQKYASLFISIEIASTSTLPGSNDSDNYFSLKIDNIGFYQVIAAKSYSCDVSSLTLTKGSTHQVNVTTNPVSANEPITWKSSNTTCATVSSSGLITAVGAGTATIYVFSDDNLNGTMDNSEVGTLITIQVNDYPEYDFSKVTLADNFEPGGPYKLGFEFDDIYSFEVDNTEHFDYIVFSGKVNDTTYYSVPISVTNVYDLNGLSWSLSKTSGSGEYGVTVESFVPSTGTPNVSGKSIFYFFNNAGWTDVSVSKYSDYKYYADYSSFSDKNSAWTDANAMVKVYWWNDSENGWVSLTNDSNTGYMAFNLPSQATHFKLVRLDPSAGDDTSKYWNDGIKWNDATDHNAISSGFKLITVTGWNSSSDSTYVHTKHSLTKTSEKVTYFATSNASGALEFTYSDDGQYWFIDTYEDGYLISKYGVTPDTDSVVFLSGFSSNNVHTSKLQSDNKSLWEIAQDSDGLFLYNIGCEQYLQRGNKTSSTTTLEGKIYNSYSSTTGLIYIYQGVEQAALILDKSNISGFTGSTHSLQAVYANYNDEVSYSFTSSDPSKVSVSFNADTGIATVSLLAETDDSLVITATAYYGDEQSSSKTCTVSSTRNYYGSYSLVTDVSELTAGAYYVIGSASSGSASFVANTNTGNYLSVCAYPETISNNDISISSSNITSNILIFKLEGNSTDGWKLKTVNYSSSSNGYIEGTDTGQGISISNTANFGLFSISEKSNTNLFNFVSKSKSSSKNLKFNLPNGSDSFSDFRFGGTCDLALYRYSALAELSSTSLNGFTGQSTNLNVSTSGFINPTYLWTASNDKISIESNNSSATINFLSTGSATVTCQVSDSFFNLKTLSCNITVEQSISSISSDLTGLQVITLGSVNDINVTNTVSGIYSGATLKFVYTNHENISVVKRDGVYKVTAKALGSSDVTFFNDINRDGNYDSNETVGAITIHFVVAYSNGGYYQLVTSADQIESGARYIISSTSTGSKIVSLPLANSGFPLTTRDELSYNSNAIINSTPGNGQEIANEFIAELTLINENQYVSLIYNYDSSYSYVSVLDASGSKKLASTSNLSDDNRFTLTFNNGKFTFVATNSSFGTKSLRCTNQYFQANNTATELYLFKQIILEAAPAESTIYTGDNNTNINIIYNENFFSNVSTSSSSSTVASVSFNSETSKWELTPNKSGTSTITISAFVDENENDTYDSGEIRVQKTFTITVKTVTITSIKISGTPSTLIYSYGQDGTAPEFDPTGLTVTAYFIDDSDTVSSRDVTSSVSWTTPLTLGMNRVTASYKYKNQATKYDYIYGIEVYSYGAVKATYNVTGGLAFALNGETTAPTGSSVSASKDGGSVTYDSTNGYITITKDAIYSISLNNYVGCTIEGIIFKIKGTQTGSSSGFTISLGSYGTIASLESTPMKNWFAEGYRASNTTEYYFNVYLGNHVATLKSNETLTISFNVTVSSLRLYEFSIVYSDGLTLGQSGTLTNATQYATDAFDASGVTFTEQYYGRGDATELLASSISFPTLDMDMNTNGSITGTYLGRNITVNGLTVIEPSVSGLTIEPDSMSLYEGDSKDAVEYSISSAGPVGELSVSWTTSDSSICDVNATTGALEALSAGTVTITAKVTYKSVEYSDSFTVNVSCLYQLFERITELSSISGEGVHYVLTQNVANGEAKALSFSNSLTKPKLNKLGAVVQAETDTVNVSTLDFGDDGTLSTIYDNISKYGIVVEPVLINEKTVYTLKTFEGKYLANTSGNQINEVAEPFYWNIVKTDQGFRISSTADTPKSLKFVTDSDTGITTIGAYSEGNVFKIYKAVEESITYTDDGNTFAEDILDPTTGCLTCDATGAKAPCTSKEWSDFASTNITGDNAKYIKAYLSSATYEYDGVEVTATNSTTDEVAEFICKYDYVVAKYGYEDYLDRNSEKNPYYQNSTKPNLVTGRTSLELNNEDVTASLIIVASIALLTATGCLSYFAIKKKKEEK